MEFKASNMIGGKPVLLIYILLAVVLVLGLISLIPIGIEAEYKDKLYCIFKIGFIKIKILPRKVKDKNIQINKKKAKKKQPDTEVEFSFKMLLQQNGISGFIKILKKFVSLTKGALKDLVKHIIIRELCVDVVVGGEDAAETAVSYGKICSVVYPSVSLITQACRCNEFKVLVSPDFADGSPSKAYCKLVADAKVFWLAKAAIVNGFKAIQLFIKYKKAQEKVPVDNNMDNNPNQENNSQTENK